MHELIKTFVVTHSCDYASVLPTHGHNKPRVNDVPCDDKSEEK